MRTAQFLTIRSASGWITTLALLALILFGVSTLTYKNGLSAYSKEGAIRLELFVTFLKGILEKYESLPELLARDEQLANFLLNPGGRERIEAFNRYLQTINQISKTADTYLMDKDGLTIAASNWQEERPFVGRNFSYRPYFQQAMKGQLGRYFALGTTSSLRGYYFAFPVRRNDEILGAVVVKIDIDTVEEKWGYHNETFLVTDPDNVIFLTTNPDWRFRTFGEIDLATKALITRSRRYPDSELQSIAIREVKDYPFGSVVNSTTEAGEVRTFLQQSFHMPEAGWDVHILSDVRPIRKKIIEVNFLVGSGFLFGYLCLILLKQRRQRLFELKRYEDQARRVLQEANEKLETRVSERTSELTRANMKLLQEVNERKNTEEILKRTRSELVHAAKMATLGQLAAGINHELNQPLAAIRSYSDNGRQLLLKGRMTEAAWNMEQISELTERMAQIGVQLKVFSRKSSGQLAVVPLHGAFDGALEILSPTIKKAQVRINVRLDPADLEVRANQLMLQQVLVNILNNGIHAVEDSEEKVIEVQARLEEERARITCTDSGPGIAPENLPHIFEPFFTTKQSGRGLGLGLTITERIVKEMAGEIFVEPAERGARFVITLPAA